MDKTVQGLSDKYINYFKKRNKELGDKSKDVELGLDVVYSSSLYSLPDGKFSSKKIINSIVMVPSYIAMPFDDYKNPDKYKKYIACNSIFFACDILTGQKNNEESYKKLIESCLIELRNGDKPIKKSDEIVLLKSALNFVQFKLKYNFSNEAELKKSEMFLKNIINEFEFSYPIKDLELIDIKKNNQDIDNIFTVFTYNCCREKFDAMNLKNIIAINENLEKFHSKKQESLVYNSGNLDFQGASIHFDSITDVQSTAIIKYFNETVDFSSIVSFQNSRKPLKIPNKNDRTLISAVSNSDFLDMRSFSTSFLNQLFLEFVNLKIEVQNNDVLERSVQLRALLLTALKKFNEHIVQRSDDERSDITFILNRPMATKFRDKDGGVQFTTIADCLLEINKIDGLSPLEKQTIQQTMKLTNVLVEQGKELVHSGKIAKLYTMSEMVQDFGIDKQKFNTDNPLKLEDVGLVQKFTASPLNPLENLNGKTTEEKVKFIVGNVLKNDLIITDSNGNSSEKVRESALQSVFAQREFISLFDESNYKSSAKLLKEIASNEGFRKIGKFLPYNSFDVFFKNFADFDNEAKKNIYMVAMSGVPPLNYNKLSEFFANSLSSEPCDSEILIATINSQFFDSVFNSLSPRSTDKIINFLLSNSFTYNSKINLNLLVRLVAQRPQYSKKLGIACFNALNKSDSIDDLLSKQLIEFIAGSEQYVGVLKNLNSKNCNTSTKIKVIDYIASMDDAKHNESSVSFVNTIKRNSKSLPSVSSVKRDNEKVCFDVVIAATTKDAKEAEELSNIGLKLLTRSGGSSLNLSNVLKYLDNEKDKRRGNKGNSLKLLEKYLSNPKAEISNKLLGKIIQTFPINFKASNGIQEVIDSQNKVFSLLANHELAADIIPFILSKKPELLNNPDFASYFIASIKDENCLKFFVSEITRKRSFGRKPYLSTLSVEGRDAIISSIIQIDNPNDAVLIKKFSGFLSQEQKTRVESRFQELNTAAIKYMNSIMEKNSKVVIEEEEFLNHLSHLGPAEQQFKFQAVLDLPNDRFSDDFAKSKQITQFLISNKVDNSSLLVDFKQKFNTQQVSTRPGTPIGYQTTNITESPVVTDENTRGHIGYQTTNITESPVVTDEKISSRTNFIDCVKWINDSTELQKEELLVRLAGFQQDDKEKILYSLFTLKKADIGQDLCDSLNSIVENTGNQSLIDLFSEVKKSSIKTNENTHFRDLLRKQRGGGQGMYQ